MTQTLPPAPAIWRAESAGPPDMPEQPAAGYRVSVIDQARLFAAMGEEWDDLLRRAGVANMFQSHAWIAAWLKYFPPRQLLLVLVRDAESRLVGALPLTINLGHQGLCWRALRFARIPGTELSLCDWLAIPVDRNADQDAVLAAIGQILQAYRRQWDVLELECLTDPDQARALARHISGCAYQLSAGAVMPIRPELPDSQEAFAASRDRKLRYEIKRRRGDIEKALGHSPRLVFAEPGPQADALFERFARLHMTYWESKGFPSHFRRFPQLIAFYKEVFRTAWYRPEADRPGMTFTVQQAGETHLSYQIGFFQGGGHLNYINTYLQEYADFRPGILHMDAMQAETIRQGGRWFNFGRGEEKYKRLWATHQQTLWDLRLFAGPSARLLWQADTRLKDCVRMLRKRKP